MSGKKVHEIAEALALIYTAMERHGYNYRAERPDGHSRADYAKASIHKE
jgi:hypothetical protein